MNKNTSRKKYIHRGLLILRKISKFDAIRCQILRLKYTKFDFRWGFAPDPAGEVCSAPPDPLTVFNGAPPTSKGREGVEREERKEGREGEDLPDQCQTASTCTFLVVLGHTETCPQLIIFNFIHKRAAAVRPLSAGIVASCL